MWGDRASLLKVIAHPVRLMILDALSGGPQCVKDLNTLVDLKQAHLSQHIAALRKAKLIDSHANGALRCYYVCRPTLIRKLMHLLHKDHPYQEQKRTVILRQIQRNK
jgi:ArsR family transcriptional regulator